jgi:AcrR family transcriptional regulator
MQNRRTQKERREEMRERLMKATINCLHQYGYHGASLPRILEEAGVSRGAWSHHFKTKKELIAEAARESLFKSAIQQAIEDSPDFMSKEQLPELFDYIWKNFYQGKVRDVWVELTVACRADVELRELLVPVFDEFVVSLDALWRKFFRSSSPHNTPVEKILNLTLYVIGGMGLQSILHDNPAYYQSLRNLWSEMILPMLEIKAEK